MNAAICYTHAARRAPLTSRERVALNGHFVTRRGKMRDPREAGQPRMSPQWAMVMARFDDMANGIARLEGRLDASDRETRIEMQELRDQIQRTRDEVAQASLNQDRARDEADGIIIEHIEGVAARVEELEATRKPDVAAALNAAAAQAGRKGANAAWSALPLTGKITAIVGALGVSGTMIAGFVESLPNVAAGISRIIHAIGNAGPPPPPAA